MCAEWMRWVDPKPATPLEHRSSVDAVMEEKVEEAGVDRDAMVFGSVTDVDGDFYSLS
jgi:hypothetical protein